MIEMRVYANDQYIYCSGAMMATFLILFLLEKKIE